MRRRVFAGLLGCLLAACAIQEPPPGGPADDKPPRIVATFPPPDSAGISPGSEIRMSFDEPMARSRLERSVTAFPRIKVGKVSWKGNTMVLIPDGPLHADTTYVIEVKPGYADDHGVKTVDAYRFAFATSAAIDSGAISGHVVFRRKPSQKAVVRLFVLPRDSAFAPEVTLADREIAVNKEGMYRFRYLPTDDRTFLVWAFEDADGNGAFSADRDHAAEVGDSVRLTVSAAVSDDVDLAIVDLREPGEIAGTIVNATGDTFPIMVAAHAVADTAPRAYYTHPDTSGAFRLSQVAPGRYTLWAFMDFRPDSLCGTYVCRDDSTRTCIEPCKQHPDTLKINPGAKVEAGELTIKPPEAKEK